MVNVSTSPLRFLQFCGRGRNGARDYRFLERKDPFRSGQVCHTPRIGFKLNTIERMISKPSEAKAYERDNY